MTVALEEEKESILYSHGHLHLPTNNEDAGSIWMREECIQEDDDITEIGRRLQRDGYAIVPGAVSERRIARARSYVRKNWDKWQCEPRCRFDDWRMHYMQEYDQPLRDGHLAIAELLSPRLVAIAENLAQRKIQGVFYTQLAYRTPLKKRHKGVKPYHIDGEANTKGARFPDHFSLLIGVALSPQSEPGHGNFTVFPGSHHRDWSTYPHLKCSKSLPDLGRPHELCLDLGDAFLVHPLLPHRGGYNTSSITRELIFFRLQFFPIQYCDPSRPSRLLQKKFLFSELPTVALLADSSSPLCLVDTTLSVANDKREE